MNSVGKKLWAKVATNTFRASLGKFGQKSFAHPKICQLLHLCRCSFSSSTMGRKTDAFTWPSLLRHFSKCKMQLESNCCYPYWMCSAWGGSSNAFLRVRQQKCCRRPTTQHTPAEHWGAYCRQDLCHWSASLQEQGFLQETHCTTADKLVIPNFSLAGSILSRNHSLATFVHERLEWSLVDQSPEQSETEWLCVDIARYKIVNVYKPPLSRLTPSITPTFPHPSLYVGDFNCQHVNWGYNIPRRWEPGLLGNMQQPWTVVQPKWNSQFLLSPLERRHQPRPGLREPRPGQPTAGQTCPRKVPAVTTSALPHNATKIQGSCRQRSGEALELSQGWLEALCLLTGESVERLPHPDTPDIERAYQDFCESLLSAAKQCIPRGRRKNNVPCWDKECENLYRSFIRALVGTASDRASSSLLSQLQKKKQERWEEAVNSIDFSHSSLKAWRTINKLTGRSGRSFHQFPVSANSIASQLMKNGAHGTGNRKPAGWPPRCCQTYGRFQHLSVIVPLNPLGRRSLLMPSDVWSHESLREWIPYSRSSYSTPGRLSNLGFATSSFPACANSKFQRSGEEH